MKIRKAKPKDFRQIAQIVKNEYKITYKEKYTDMSALRLVKYFYKLGTIYVAEIDKKVVGFIAGRFEPREIGWAMVVEEFAVDSNYQRQGIGRKLMKKMEQLAKSSKVYMIYLLTHKTAPAEKFYRAVGYQEYKDAVVFSKRLK